MRSSAGGPGRRSGSRSACAQARARPQPGDRWHAAVGQLAAGLIVDQVGKGGGDQRGGLGLVGAGDDPGPDRGPGGCRFRRQALRVVVEDQQLVDCRVVADGHHDPPQEVRVVPDHRRVVERVADGRRVRQQLGQALAGRGGQLGQLGAEVSGLVGGDARVAARAGEDREPAVAARPGPRLGRRGRAPAAREGRRPRPPPASSTRARKTRWSPATAPVCAEAARAPASEAPDLQHGDAGRRARRSVRTPRPDARRRRPPPGTSPPSGRRRARRRRRASRWRRARPGCRWRAPCGSGSPGVSRAR